MTEELLTVDEVAKIFRVSPRTVERNSKLGKLPKPVKVGTQNRWRKSDVDEYLKKQ